MAKKQFKEAVSRTRLATLIPTEEITEQELRKLARQRKAAGIGRVGRPKRKDKDNATASAAEKGTLPGEMRRTYLVGKEQAEMLDRIAYWQRTTIKEVVAAAFQSYIKAYERKNGPIKSK